MKDASQKLKPWSRHSSLETSAPDNVKASEVKSPRNNNNGVSSTTSLENKPIDEPPPSSVEFLKACRLSKSSINDSYQKELNAPVTPTLEPLSSKTQPTRRSTSNLIANCDADSSPKDPVLIDALVAESKSRIIAPRTSRKPSLNKSEGGDTEPLGNMISSQRSSQGKLLLEPDDKELEKAVESTFRNIILCHACLIN